MNVLVINAGSSSLKYQLFNMDNETILAKGLCERIGMENMTGHIKHTPLSTGKEPFEADIDLPSHAEAITAVIEKLTDSEYGVIGSLGGSAPWDTASSTAVRSSQPAFW
jgi:acetate kinase